MRCYRSGEQREVDAHKRYNLIHAYFASADTAKRAASLGAVVDTQPMWFYKDGDALLKALGPKYLNTFIGVKTWKDNGVTVARMPTTCRASIRWAR